MDVYVHTRSFIYSYILDPRIKARRKKKKLNNSVREEEEEEEAQARFLQAKIKLNNLQKIKLNNYHYNY